MSVSVPPTTTQLYQKQKLPSYVCDKNTAGLTKRFYFLGMVLQFMAALAWYKRPGQGQRRHAIVLLLSLCLLLISQFALASIDVYEFDSPQQEAQYRALIDEFRCPKCQNQNLAGSDAPIAQDLKQKTYDMVQEGRSDAEIRSYMFERYGDFISYKPPVRPSTWILWFFPPILLLVLIAAWFWRTRRQQLALAATSNDGVITAVDGMRGDASTHTQDASGIASHTDSDASPEQSAASVEASAAALSSDEQARLNALLAQHPSHADIDADIDNPQAKYSTAKYSKAKE